MSGLGDHEGQSLFLPNRFRYRVLQYDGDRYFSAKNLLQYRVFCKYRVLQYDGDRQFLPKICFRTERSASIGCFNMMGTDMISAKNLLQYRVFCKNRGDSGLLSTRCLFFWGTGSSCKLVTVASWAHAAYSSEVQGIPANWWQWPLEHTLPILLRYRVFLQTGDSGLLSTRCLFFWGTGYSCKLVTVASWAHAAYSSEVQGFPANWRQWPLEHTLPILLKYRVFLQTGDSGLLSTRCLFFWGTGFSCKLVTVASRAHAAYSAAVQG